MIVSPLASWQLSRCVVEIYPEAPTDKEFFLRREPYQLADVSVEVRKPGMRELEVIIRGGPTCA